MDYVVTVSDHAFDEMVLAASEAYVLGNAREWGFVEIQGYLWGGRRTTDDVEYIDVQKFSVSASATGDGDSVAVDARVARLKNSILAHWSPHFHLLGTFHTHPYAALNDVEESKGWDFSDADEKAFLNDDDLWELSAPEMPIMMVMAVTRMQTVFDSMIKLTSNGGIEFNVGDLRFWLSVGVGEVLKSQDKVFSRDSIVLNQLGRYFNPAGSWLDGTE